MDGEDGDEHSPLRTSPGRKMDEVIRCALYGGWFQMTDKPAGVRIEGYMRVLLKVDGGLTMGV